MLGLPLRQVFGNSLPEEGAGTVSYQKNKTGVHTKLVIVLRNNIGYRHCVHSIYSKEMRLQQSPSLCNRISLLNRLVERATGEKVCMGLDLLLHSIDLISLGDLLRES